MATPTAEKSHIVEDFVKKEDSETAAVCLSA